jgi:hypothetical protein
MTIQQTTPAITFSIRKGINFYFEDGDNEIRAFGSTLSGKEIIYLNGEEVSNKRSMRFSSVHSFSAQKIEYEIEFSVADIMLGKVDCTLIKNKVHYKTLKFSFWNNKKTVFNSLLLVGALAGIAGYAIGYYLFRGL